MDVKEWFRGHVFNHSRPIYQQLIERIYQIIVGEGLQPGEKLPSVRELGQEVGVNPNTVQRAYTEMERNKIVETRRGQGTFVTENRMLLIELKKESATMKVKEFVKHMSDIGFSKKEILQLITEELSKEGN